MDLPRVHTIQEKKEVQVEDMLPTLREKRGVDLSLSTGIVPLLQGELHSHSRLYINLTNLLLYRMERRRSLSPRRGNGYSAPLPSNGDYYSNRGPPPPGSGYGRPTSPPRYPPLDDPYSRR